MSTRTVTGHNNSRADGQVCVPGDKSIAHRVLILGAMARGTTYARGVPDSDDIKATIRCLEALGVRCERADTAVSIEGLDKMKFQNPAQAIDCGGSATTLRLMMGAIAGRGQSATLTGTETLCGRPIDRVIDPLTRMGARFDASRSNTYAPVTVVAPEAGLEPIDYDLTIPSAQVKSAIILAGLSSRSGRTRIRGAIGSRDHTERLVPRMGGSLVLTDDAIIVEPSQLTGIATTIPGDPSAAAFHAAAAAMLRNSRVVIRSVCTNPTRMGFFEALSWMGADVTTEDRTKDEFEPVGDITVRWAPLRSIAIDFDAVPYLIDEIPLLIMLACFAEGETVIHGVSELHIKESDRATCTVEGLRKMGAQLRLDGDSIRVQGGHPLHGAHLDPCGDHRMSMMFTLAAHAATGTSTIEGVECEDKSYPGFIGALQEIIQ